MRGTATAAEHHLRLSDDVVPHVDADSHIAGHPLSGALGHIGEQRWSGIRVRHEEPAEHLDLWLATSGGLPFARIAVGEVDSCYLVGASPGDLLQLERRLAGVGIASSRLSADDDGTQKPDVLSRLSLNVAH